MYLLVTTVNCLKRQKKIIDFQEIKQKVWATLQSVVQSVYLYLFTFVYLKMDTNAEKSKMALD